MKYLSFTVAMDSPDVQEMGGAMLAGFAEMVKVPFKGQVHNSRIVPRTGIVNIEVGDMSDADMFYLAEKLKAAGSIVNYSTYTVEEMGHDGNK